jgi:hypothetical protein
LVEAEVEDMAVVIEKYLRTESERTKITDAAYNLAINDLSMRHSVGRVMRFVEESIKGMYENVLN